MAHFIPSEKLQATFRQPTKEETEFNILVEKSILNGRLPIDYILGFTDNGPKH